MGLKDKLEYWWNPEKKEAALLSDYVDVLNQFGLGSEEERYKSLSIVRQCPSVAGLLDETHLLLCYHILSQPPQIFK